jgi:hypothetical protein
MARVWTAAKSDPAVGSDSAIAPIHLPWAERRSNSSLRASSIVCVPSPWPRARMLPTESQAREFFGGKAVFENAEPHTAVLSGNGNAEPALCGHLIDKALRHLRLLGIELVRDR